MRNRRGAIIVLVGVAMVGLMGLVALATDAGAIARQKRMTQTAADAGALAGAIEIFRAHRDSIVPTAMGESQRNGYTHTVAGVNVTVTNPTTSGFFVGPDFVEVTVSKILPLTFAGFLGFPSVTVRSKAIGGFGPSLTCLVVTEPTEPNALYVKSGSLTTQDCAIAVNSTNSAAVATPANGDIVATSLSVTGGPAAAPAGVTGTYRAGSTALSDPLAYLTMPTVGACNGAYGAYANYAGGTLSPGVYCGGIGIDHAVAVFNPGVYILAGGGLDFKHATVTGNGVTFVNTNAPAANGGASYQPIDMDVNSNVSLSACTVYDAVLCPMPGILFYQDPAASPALDPSGEPWVNSLGSSAAATFNGTIYFPTQVLASKSRSPLTINGGAVVLRLEITTGQQNIIVTGASAGAYFAIKRPTIVE
ncbi:MAG TPA: pilus assembly protein TadG-related protein [Gemmatimonadaceae bacterium]|nr:pilus assembly protein TadG-related protein [Gemmatimonadaceae bacterium]